MTIALIMFVAFSVLSSLELAKGLMAVDFTHRGSDPISVYDRRFKPLAGLLKETEVVGYFAGGTPEQVKGNSQALAAYYLAQYALAPVIVVNEHERELLIGNLRPGLATTALLQSYHLKVVRDLGNGLFLLTKEER